MATFSPSATVQLAINAAREAGLLDAPVRFARPLDDGGTPVQIYLANGRVVVWPPVEAAAEPDARAADTSEAAGGDQDPTPPQPPSPRRRKK